MAQIDTALDELDALATAGARRPYVTEDTRRTIRNVTGMTVNMTERWTQDDIKVAATALREAQGGTR